MFGLENGKPLHPDAITSRLRRISRDLGLPWIKSTGCGTPTPRSCSRPAFTPGSCRSASGHGSISITMDTYSHAIPSMQNEAADLGAALIDGPSAASYPSDH